MMIKPPRYIPNRRLKPTIRSAPIAQTAKPIRIVGASVKPALDASQTANKNPTDGKIPNSIPWLNWVTDWRSPLDDE